MKNDYTAIYVFLFFIFLGLVFAFCFICTRYLRQSESDSRIIEDCRRDLAESRAINNELTIELEECRRRIEQTETDLRRTTERLRDSNQRLGDIAGIIAESARTGATAADAVTRAREIIRGLDQQIAQVREIIESQKLDNFYSDSE